MKAFWFDGEYYLLPPGFPDVAAFCAQADFSQPLTLIRLVAEKAYPPFFAIEKQFEETVTISSPDRIHPLEVELLSEEELAKRAEAAARPCLGCRWCGGSRVEAGESCAQLSLSGPCPVYESGFDPGFRFYAEAFWRRVRAAINAKPRNPFMTELMLGRRIVRLVDRLRYAIPDVFIGFTMRTSPRPTLLLSGAGNDFLHLVAQYLTLVAPTAITDRFDVIPYFPAGIYTRRESGSNGRMDRKPPQVIAVPVRTDRPRFDLTIVVYEATKDSAADDAFLYLCEQLGEPKVMGAMNSIRFVDDSGFDLDFHDKVIDFNEPGLQLLDVDAYGKQIDLAYAAETDRSGLNLPDCHYEFFDITEEEPVGRLADVKRVNSCYMDLDEDLLFDETEAMPDVFEQGIGIGAIACNLALGSQKAGEAAAEIETWLDRSLHLAGGSVPFSVHAAERRTIFHFLILDKRIVRQAVRALTPLLKGYGAEYTEIWPQGRWTCQVDFHLAIDDPESDSLRR